MVPSSSLFCQRTRSPTTAWLFLPRGWQISLSPVGVSTMQWRPWPATTSPSFNVEAAAPEAPFRLANSMPPDHDDVAGASKALVCEAHSRSVVEMPATS